MSHSDEEDLAVIALGETPGPEDEAHLATCARCRSQLDQLTAVVASARTITDADRPVPPPLDVWDTITRELGHDLDRDADVIPIGRAAGRRRMSAWLVPAAAAVMGVVLGGLVTWQLTSTGTEAQLLSSGALDPIGESGLVGTAQVAQVADHATLTVSVPGLPAADDGYYEVWMATPDTTTMVAIGTINPGEEATFTLPQGMTVSAFPVVDVSLEHFDGDAGHSATSIVRGTLSS